jgi:hypothetical protein
LTAEEGSVAASEEEEVHCVSISHRVRTRTLPITTLPVSSRSIRSRMGLLCNRVIVFDDTGEPLLDARSVPIHRDMFEQAAA